MIADTRGMRGYVARWFVDRAQFERMCGCTAGELDALLAAGAAPGPIYALEAGGWWSALGQSQGLHGPLSAQSTRYYSPGAAWWVRRAVLLARGGMCAAEAAAANAQAFARQFVAALASDAVANRAFSNCFVDGEVDTDAAMDRAAAEWRDWIGGGYAVCLHHFTGWSCVLKESLAFEMRARLEPEPTQGDGAEPLALLDLAHRLSGLILPFSPEERPRGAPGLTIDRLLARERLGEAMACSG